jgi:hypothetical protein
MAPSGEPFIIDFLHSINASEATLIVASRWRLCFLEGYGEICACKAKESPPFSHYF